MGQWQIRGADRSSGRDVGQIYDADTREQAADLAVKDGMLVETIELLADDNTLPIEPLEPMDALEVALRREAREQNGTAAPPRYGDTAKHEMRLSGQAPKYGGLLIAGRVIRCFAIVYYFIALLALISAVWTVIAMGFVFEPRQLVLFAWPLGVGMVGALLHGVGSACFALRDMARNSWR